jgi:sortase A
VPVRDKLPRFRAPRKGARGNHEPLNIRFRKFFAKIGKFQFSLASAQDALGKISKIRFTRRTVDNVVGVTGELLMTAGVFVLLFLGWHLWYNDIVSGIAQDNAGAALTEEWNTVPAAVPEFDRSEGTSSGIAVAIEPPVTPSGAAGDRFATMLVPRFGATFERAIAGGIDPKTVLNIRSAGIGHYSQTDDLGEIGNFAVAAHRTTYGAPFGNIGELRVGDRLYIETNAGWYVYRFRNLDYVWPNNTSVLKSVPESSVKAQGRILTLTSCHPKMSLAERVIAYSVFETFVPRDRGAPAEVVAIKAGG